MKSLRIHCPHTCPRNRTRGPPARRGDGSTGSPASGRAGGPFGGPVGGRARARTRGAPVPARGARFRPVVIRFRPVVIRFRPVVIWVHTVQWTGHGPRFSAFTRPLSANAAVT